MYIIRKYNYTKRNNIFSCINIHPYIIFNKFYEAINTTVPELYIGRNIIIYRHTLIICRYRIIFYTDVNLEKYTKFM